MPIEIKELHIRVTVDASRRKNQVENRTFSGGIGSSIYETRDAIVSECVEQVLSILLAKKER
ncbi:MAG: DUF5908 family protein [Candidatus Methylomirabilis sp.]|nr:DUF5908 family protein [Deltaproteobacteria bacterium]